MKAIAISKSDYDQLYAGIESIYASKSIAKYWQPSSVKIKSGVNQGKVAVILDDATLNQPMWTGVNYKEDKNDVVRLKDMPDFALMMKSIGSPPIINISDSDLDLPAAPIFP